MSHVYILAYFPAEGGGCSQALDAVTYEASFPGNRIYRSAGKGSANSDPVFAWVHILN
jgi:hypothetical protein